MLVAEYTIMTNNIEDKILGEDLPLIRHNQMTCIKKRRQSNVNIQVTLQSSEINMIKEPGHSLISGSLPRLPIRVELYRQKLRENEALEN